MKHSNDNMPPLVDQLRQLEAETHLLRTENQQLRAENAALQLQLKQEQDLEKKYQESQARFETIFYESKLGNKIIGPDLKVIQVNASLQEILGYSEKELVGSQITEFAHPNFIHHWRQLQENLWTRQIPSFQIETCLIKKDGSSLWCQVTSILIPNKPTPLGYTIVEDINSRKALEVELHHLYDQQESIMHMIVHDLKNYLFNVKSLNELMQEELANPTTASEKQNSCLPLIKMTSDVCEQALAIINDILLIGRIESIKTEYEKTDLVAFIHDQLPGLMLEAHKKGIQVNFHHPQEPVYARISPGIFKRVTENLMSNAVKFTPAGGQVTISLENKGGKALLQVRDTGIGIPEHLQASIFQKFTRAGRIGTAGETSTGLGLYIVKHIVEQHKGTVWMESKEKEGTAFFIQLP